MRTTTPTPRSPLETRSTQPHVRALLLHLAAERGLADNTIHAYRRDLEHLEDAFRARGLSLTTARADDFRNYLQGMRRNGQATKTVARRLAAIRVFLRYLAAEGFDVVNILQQLE